MTLVERKVVSQRAKELFRQGVEYADFQAMYELEHGKLDDKILALLDQK
jgi:hypothetical protein